MLESRTRLSHRSARPTRGCDPAGVCRRTPVRGFGGIKLMARPLDGVLRQPKGCRTVHSQTKVCGTVAVLLLSACSHEDPRFDAPRPANPIAVHLATALHRSTPRHLRGHRRRPAARTMTTLSSKLTGYVQGNRIQAGDHVNAGGRATHHPGSWPTRRQLSPCRNRPRGGAKFHP